MSFFLCRGGWGKLCPLFPRLCCFRFKVFGGGSGVIFLPRGGHVFCCFRFTGLEAETVPMVFAGGWKDYGFSSSRIVFCRQHRNRTSCLPQPFDLGVPGPLQTGH